jgi:hypothetical protein
MYGQGFEVQFSSLLPPMFDDRSPAVFLKPELDCDRSSLADYKYSTKPSKLQHQVIRIAYRWIDQWSSWGWSHT